MPTWSVIYILILLASFSSEISCSIKRNKSSSYIILEVLATVSALIILFAYWNRTISDMLGYIIILITAYFIGWEIYSATKRIKDIGVWGVGDFAKQLSILAIFIGILLMAPVVILGVRQSLKLFAH